MFPPPWAMARLGEAFADQRSAGTIARCQQQTGEWERYAREWEEYARTLMQNADQHRAENDLLMSYIRDLKTLYCAVILDANDRYGARYPLPPSGIIGWLRGRVTQLEFFESAIDGEPPVERRVYGTTFEKSSTRCINMDMSLSIVPPAQQLTCPITVNWYSFEQDANVYSKEIEHELMPDTESFSFTDGCGYKQPGHWAEGKYAVNVYFGAEFGAQGVFEIV